MKPSKNAELELASEFVLTFHAAVSPIHGDGSDFARVVTQGAAFWKSGLRWVSEGLLMLSFLLGPGHRRNGVGNVLL